MRVHVDEAGHDQTSGRVDLVRTVNARANADDPATRDADVGEEPGPAGPVDDRAAAYGEVDVGTHAGVSAGTSNPYSRAQFVAVTRTAARRGSPATSPPTISRLRGNVDSVWG